MLLTMIFQCFVVRMSRWMFLCPRTFFRQLSMSKTKLLMIFFKRRTFPRRWSRTLSTNVFFFTTFGRHCCVRGWVTSVFPVASKFVLHAVQNSSDNFFSATDFFRQRTFFSATDIFLQKLTTATNVFDNFRWVLTSRRQASSAGFVSVPL